MGRITTKERELRAERTRAFQARKAHNKKKDKRLFGRFSKKHRAKKLRRDFGDELDAQQND